MSPKIKIALQLLACLACTLYFVGALEFAGDPFPFSILKFIVVITGIVALLAAFFFGAMAIETYDWYFRH